MIRITKNLQTATISPDYFNNNLSLQEFRENINGLYHSTLQLVNKIMWYFNTFGLVNVSQSTLAKSLGITRETVSRLIGKLKKLGLIAIQYTVDGVKTYAHYFLHPFFYEYPKAIAHKITLLKYLSIRLLKAIYIKNVTQYIKGNILYKKTADYLSCFGTKMSALPVTYDDSGYRPWIGTDHLSNESDVKEHNQRSLTDQEWEEILSSSSCPPPTLIFCKKEKTSIAKDTLPKPCSISIADTPEVNQEAKNGLGSLLGILKVNMNGLSKFSQHKTERHSSRNNYWKEVD